MQAILTMSQIYWNKSLFDFFFRNQSEKEFYKVRDIYNDIHDNTDDFLDLLEESYDDIDSLEEDFYSLTTEELCQKIGIEIQDEDEDETEL